MYHIKVCFFGNEEHEKVNDFLLGWQHWKIVIGYACILARITERGVPFRPQRGLPFAAVKRLALCLVKSFALCVGEGHCHLDLLGLIFS